MPRRNTNGRGRRYPAVSGHDHEDQAVTGTGAGDDGPAVVEVAGDVGAARPGAVARSGDAQ